MSDVLLKVQKGLSSAIATAAIENGSFKITTDSQKIYVDLDNARLPLNDVVLDKTAAQIKTTSAANALPKLYLASDTMDLYYYDSTTYVPEGESEAVAKGWTIIGSTTFQTKAQAQADYNTLQNLINNMNSFEIEVIDNIANAPAPGDAGFNTHKIYFAPDNSIPTTGDKNVYAEYIWITTDDTTSPITGHYEIIGTTEAELTNYYTKDEVDTLDNQLWTALGITYAESTAASYATVDDRLGSLEDASAEFTAKFGNYASSTTAGFVSVEDRFVAAEGRLDTAEADIDAAEGRLDTAEANITELNAKLGTMAASTADDFVSVEDRLTALETSTADQDAITEINAKLGNYLASTADNFVSVEDRFTAAEGRLTTAESDIDAAEADIDEIQAQLGGYASSTAVGFVSVESRFVTDEADITEINAKLGAMADSTSANFKTVEERLQAVEDLSDQEEDTDNAEKPVLVSAGENHDEIEYASGVTINAVNNSVKADAIVLGDATLTFDSVAGALVVNF